MQTSVIRWLLLAILTFSGCRMFSDPVSLPMVPRPSEEQQKAIDDAWRAILANALSRGTLRDTFAYSCLYVNGVDRAGYHAEKNVDDKLVLMDVTYEKERPALDAFRIRIVDAQGATIRDETYSREDVVSALPLLAQPGTEMSLAHGIRPSHMTPAETQPAATQPIQLSEEEQALIARLRAVHATTMPAESRSTEPPAPSE